MTAITAVTAQNTTGVFEVVAMEAAFVARQMEACLKDMGCDAVKVGMLANASIIESVSRTLMEQCSCPLVVDPVIAATSGGSLLDPAAVATLKNRLLPLASVVTPNLHEAGVLVGGEVKTREQMREAARAIRDLGPGNVVIKGGHLEGKPVDVLFDGRKFLEFQAERVRTKNSHGTGCIFASAIAAWLAKGKSVEDSVAAAKQFVHRAILAGLPLGSGQGPANPLFSNRFDG